MTVYKRPDSRFYRYDFVYRGTRYSASTDRTNKRDAEVVERAAREDVKRGLASEVAAAAGHMTIDEACGRYWLEVGVHTVAPRQTEWSCFWLIAQLGADKPIRDISDDDVARLIARRRVEAADNVMVARKRAKGGEVGPPRRLTAATVNRTVLEPLRRILTRARDLWGELIRPIRWREHKLAEPKERVRYATDEEEAAVLAALPAAYHPIVRFALLSGCRANECCRLTWADVHWGERQVHIVGKGKAGAPKHRSVPLTAEMREFLWPMRGEASLDASVFRNMSGAPVTYRAFYAAFATACRKAGVRNLRLHDLRHTAATRIVRATGNLKLAQALLGHEDIATTSRYAHLAGNDLRDAMEAMAAQKSHRNVPPDDVKFDGEQQI